MSEFAYCKNTEDTYFMRSGEVLKLTFLTNILNVEYDLERDLCLFFESTSKDINNKLKNIKHSPIVVNITFVLHSPQ